MCAAQTTYGLSISYTVAATGHGTNSYSDSESCKQLLRVLLHGNSVQLNWPAGLMRTLLGAHRMQSPVSPSSTELILVANAAGTLSCTDHPKLYRAVSGACRRYLVV